MTICVADYTSIVFSCLVMQTLFLIRAGWFAVRECDSKLTLGSRDDYEVLGKRALEYLTHLYSEIVASEQHLKRVEWSWLEKVSTRLRVTENQSCFAIQVHRNVREVKLAKTLRLILGILKRILQFSRCNIVYILPASITNLAWI